MCKPTKKKLLRSETLSMAWCGSCIMLRFRTSDRHPEWRVTIEHASEKMSRSVGEVILDFQIFPDYLS